MKNTEYKLEIVKAFGIEVVEDLGYFESREKAEEFVGLYFENVDETNLEYVLTK